jgi:hypothetical protein
MTEATQAVETKALTIVDQAKAVKIIDAKSYTIAGLLWKNIKDMMKEVADTFDPIIEKAHSAHKEALAKKAIFYGPLEAAYRSVKGLMSAYDAEQERIRLAEQRHLEEIARKEEAERRRIELERLEAERKIEEARLLAAAEAAQVAGDKQQAEDMVTAAIAATENARQEAAAINAEPVYVAPVVIPKTVPKMAGGPVYRTIWKFRIIDAAKIPRQYLIPDDVKIGQIVRALKKESNIPGIEPYEERC